MYILQTARNSLYTGISTDVGARIATHNRGKGAASLRGALPVQLLYCCELGNRSLAQRAEHQVKKLPAKAKHALVEAQPNHQQLLTYLGLQSPGDIA